jgi:hypothetical protein
MSVTPTGNPAWVRSNDHTTYGGDVDKKNYASQGAVNAQTDVSAEQLVRIASDLAAVQRTAPFAVITMLMRDATPAAPIVERVLLMNGVTSSSYVGDSPPSGMPTITRQGTGYVRITLSPSYTDAYGVSGSVSIIGATGSATASLARCMTADVLDVDADGVNEVVDVRVFVTTTGSASGDNRVTVALYT